MSRPGPSAEGPVTVGCAWLALVLLAVPVVGLRGSWRAALLVGVAGLLVLAAGLTILAWWVRTRRR